MRSLARLVFRRRKARDRDLARPHALRRVLGGQVSNRWLESFSIPGYSAYEANQRTLKTFGSGEQFPLVAVITAPGRDVTKAAASRRRSQAAAAKNPGGALQRLLLDRQRRMYLSKDRHTAFAEIFPPGQPGFELRLGRRSRRARSAERGRAGGREGVPDRPRSALRGVVGRRHGRPERPARGADRRARRARSSCSSSSARCRRSRCRCSPRSRRS